MYDFGFLPETLPGLALTEGYPHAKGDMYDPKHPTLGNSYITSCTNGNIKLIDYKAAGLTASDVEKKIPDWLYLKDLHVDLRMFYVKCEGNKLVSQFKWGTCGVKQLSNFSH